MANTIPARKSSVAHEWTQCGFQFGSAHVQAITELPHQRVAIGIDTPIDSLQIFATKDGKLRVYRNRVELK